MRSKNGWFWRRGGKQKPGIFFQIYSSDIATRNPRKTSPFLHWINIPQNWSMGTFGNVLFLSLSTPGREVLRETTSEGFYGRWAISGTVNYRRWPGTTINGPLLISGVGRQPFSDVKPLSRKMYTVDSFCGQGSSKLSLFLKTQCIWCLGKGFSLGKSLTYILKANCFAESSFPAQAPVVVRSIITSLPGSILHNLSTLFQKCP